MGKENELNLRQQLFVKEYLVDLNATQAALRAGYSKKTARAIGQENLTKPAIMAAISKAFEKRAVKTEITAERVLQELAIIGFADQKDYVTIGEEGQVTLIPFDCMPEGASRAVSAVKESRRIMGAGTGDGKEMTLEIKTEYRHHDKVKALELMGRHLGMFIDRNMDVPFDSEVFDMPRLAIPGGNGKNGGKGGHTD